MGSDHSVSTNGLCKKKKKNQIKKISAGPKDPLRISVLKNDLV